jgi:hypothetical protein
MHSAGSLRGSLDLHRARNQAGALERARWLEELAEAIAQAQRLTWRLGVLEGDSEEARSLYAQLESALAEVESLRFGDWAEVDPKWIQRLLDGNHALREVHEG